MIVICNAPAGRGKEQLRLSHSRRARNERKRVLEKGLSEHRIQREIAQGELCRVVILEKEGTERNVVILHGGEDRIAQRINCLEITKEHGNHLEWHTEFYRHVNSIDFKDISNYALRMKQNKDTGDGFGIERAELLFHVIADLLVKEQRPHSRTKRILNSLFVPSPFLYPCEWKRVVKETVMGERLSPIECLPRCAPVCYRRTRAF